MRKPGPTSLTHLATPLSLSLCHNITCHNYVHRVITIYYSANGVEYFPTSKTIKISDCVVSASSCFVHIRLNYIISSLTFHYTLPHLTPSLLLSPSLPRALSLPHLLPSLLLSPSLISFPAAFTPAATGNFAPITSFMFNAMLQCYRTLLLSLVSSLASLRCWPS